MPISWFKEKSRHTRVSQICQLEARHIYIIFRPTMLNLDRGVAVSTGSKLCQLKTETIHRPTVWLEQL